MPQVAADSAGLLERLVYGFDGSVYRVVKVDTDGNLVLALVAGSTIEVTQADPADLQATVNVAAGQTIQVTQATAANLKCTANVAAGQTIAVTQATPANLQAAVNVNAGQSIAAQLQGYYSGGWRNAPVPFGATAPLGIIVSNTNLAAGTNILDTAAVPANTLWVATGMAFQYVGTPPTLAAIQAIISSSAVYVFAQLEPVSAVFYDRQNWVVLGPGDAMRLRITGATAGDDAYLYVTGFTVSVA